MINVKTIENTVMVEYPCDGRDGANFALNSPSIYCSTGLHILSDK